MLIGVYNGKKYRNISTLYKHLIENRGNTTLDVKVKWEKELGIILSDDEWLNIWN